MNIQIFGKAKCFDTQKAQRYFKERGIKYQLIDLPTKGMSKGEYASVKQGVGDMTKLIDTACKAYEDQFMAHILPQAAETKLLEYPILFKTPIVRNGRQAAVGYCPEVWAKWE